MAAETAGLIIGVASFALQVRDGIERLQDARQYIKSEAGDELESLIQRLEILRHILLHLDSVQASKMVNLAINSCQGGYSSVDIALQRVSERLSSSSSRRLLVVRHSDRIKDELRGIGQTLDYVIQPLTCTIGLETRMLVQDIPNLVSSAMIASEKRHNSMSETQISITEPPSPRTACVYLEPSRRPRKTDCTVRHCHCSCHSVRRSASRFWAFEHTGPTTSRKCSNPKCTATCYRWNLQFALSRYGIPFMVKAGVEFIAGAGMYSLRPALSTERVVKYTSPGFEALARFEQGLLSVSEVQERFRGLKRGDSSLNRHIHPGGHNYVQELLRYNPIGYQDSDDRLELLEFFACELDMTLEDLDQRFLVRCARWIGEGPHLDLLEAILEYGFDPSLVESPVYEEWPLPCSPDWISQQFTPDPFFIEYLALLAKASPGFAGLTPLHEIVLLKPPAEVASFLSRSSLHWETNFLGQTPLHLAVRDVETVRLLVQGGHEKDVLDNQGITPLMYAAGMGKTDVVRFLINQGANLFIRDKRWKRTFIGYADARGHWQLIMDALDTVQAVSQGHPPELLQHFICDTLMRLISRTRIIWQSNEWSIYFAKLVALASADTCNLRISMETDGTEDNSLLHFISSHEDVEVLAQNGFRLFSEPNSAGNTPIFSLANILYPTLLWSLLDRGTNINHVNHDGRTLLFPLLKQLRHLDHRTFDVMDCIRICFKGGLDIFTPDCCRCPCSPEGCFLPAAFNITFSDLLWTSTPAFVWALEFLSLVEELRGREDSKRLLLGFLRRTYSDTVGVTHVCCHRGNSIQGHSPLQPARHMAEDDIDEILDEEEELVSSLEEEMIPFNLETLEGLRSRWISMLKERYQEQLDVVEKSRKQNKRYETPGYKKFEVDERNDTFHRVYHTGFHFHLPPVSGSMAEYVVWLEHQYCRAKDTWDADEREAWYKRRMEWFVELMQVMEVSTKALIEKVDDKIRTTSWEDRDSPDKELIVSHFRTSVQGLREAGKALL